jgi:hypothetical protein
MGMDTKTNEFVKKMTTYFKQKFPKFMQSLEKKKVWLGTINDKGHLMKGSPFTTFSITKNYGVNIYKDKDDDDKCFVMWLWKGKFRFIYLYI